LKTKYKNIILNFLSQKLDKRWLIFDCKLF
jgi:hypothetical protein